MNVFRRRKATKALQVERKPQRNLDRGASNGSLTEESASSDTDTGADDMMVGRRDSMGNDSVDMKMHQEKEKPALRLGMRRTGSTGRIAMAVPPPQQQPASSTCEDKNNAPRRRVPRRGSAGMKAAHATPVAIVKPLEQQQPEGSRPRGQKRASMSGSIAAGAPLQEMQPLAKQQEQKQQEVKSDPRRIARRGSTGMAMKSSTQQSTVLRAPLILRSCLKDKNSTDSLVSIHTNRNKSPGVRIDESRNEYHIRTFPILSLQEAQVCWYSRTECKRMGSESVEFSLEAVRSLGLAYRVCCDRIQLPQPEVECIQKFLDQEKCTGLEQLMVSQVNAVKNDKKARRQRLLELAVHRNRVIKTNEEELRNKCAFVSEPAELFALAIGQAQQQKEKVRRRNALLGSTKQLAWILRVPSAKW